MPRTLFFALPLLLTAACMEGTPEAARPGNDGVAGKLSIGVTKPKVDVALGTETGFERNPANWQESCASYTYTTAAGERFVHAVFVNDTLARASDGHRAICTYGTLVSGG